MVEEEVVGCRVEGGEWRERGGWKEEEVVRWRVEGGVWTEVPAMDDSGKNIILTYAEKMPV